MLLGDNPFCDTVSNYSLPLTLRNGCHNNELSKIKPNSEEMKTRSMLCSEISSLFPPSSHLQGGKRTDKVRVQQSTSPPCWPLTPAGSLQVGAFVTSLLSPACQSGHGTHWAYSILHPALLGSKMQATLTWGYRFNSGCRRWDFSPLRDKCLLKGHCVFPLWLVERYRHFQRMIHIIKI